jgi:hypothetical protein
MISWTAIFKPETFMFRSIHTLAMVAVLLHMLLGCCLHHTHAEQSSACCETTALHDHDEPCCHGHESDCGTHTSDACCDQDSSAPEHECIANRHDHDNSECSDDDCVFVLDQPNCRKLLIQNDASWAFVPTAASEVATAHPVAGWPSPTKTKFLSVRSHLAHSVLLL